MFYAQIFASKKGINQEKWVAKEHESAEPDLGKKLFGIILFNFVINDGKCSVEWAGSITIVYFRNCVANVNDAATPTMTPMLRRDYESN